VHEELIARGFWGPRQEPPEQIADTLVAFLTGLDDVVGETIPWSSPEFPGKVLAEPVNARQVISDAFRENTDAPHLGINQEYDVRGYRFEMLSIGMGVGGYSDSPKVQNMFMLEWCGDDAVVFADPILRHLVSVWDPDWADVTSMSLLEALADVQPAGKPMPQVGYLSYLSEGAGAGLAGRGGGAPAEARERRCHHRLGRGRRLLAGGRDRRGRTASERQRGVLGDADFSQQVLSLTNPGRCPTSEAPIVVNPMEPTDDSDREPGGLRSTGFDGIIAFTGVGPDGEG